MASVKITLKSNLIKLQDIKNSAISAGLFCQVLDTNIIDVFSSDINKISTWQNQYINNANLTTEYNLIKFRPHCKISSSPFPYLNKPSNTSVPWFTMKDLISIYNIPAPVQSTPVVVGVISFGGGLYGAVNSSGVTAAGSTGAGVLTGGDVQAYWTWLGYSTKPKVIIVPIGSAGNFPNINDGGLTIENTLDVEAVGGACPSSNLTIILYIAQNQSYNDFSTVITYIKNTNVTVNGTVYKPTIISCSWGMPEYYVKNASPSSLTNLNTTLLGLTNPPAGTKVINVCTATGDNGSNDGVGGSGSYVDFPSSCPYVTAVGGTTLVCPNNVYNSQTVETVWSGSGGGISDFYTKPSWQNGSAFTGMSGRSIPDIASLADPNTGVVILVNNIYILIGGTSLSAPTIAAYLASINCSVFFTPKLYSINQNCFHDVTTGSNGNFSAKIGYDNCTGFGTINGTNLTSGMISNTITVKTISISPTSGRLNLNQTLTLTASVLPTNATNKVVSWVSSNPLIANVSNGIVTALTPGSVSIIATSTDGTNISASIPITVIGVVVPVTSVSLSTFTRSVRVGSTTQISAQITPVNATNQRVTWTSTSPLIASVSTSGQVTGLTSGTTYILINTLDGNKTAWAQVNVTLSLSQKTNISINPQLTLVSGAHFLLVPTFDSSETEILWTSSDNSIASVDQNGLVSGVATGTATISVSDGNSESQCVVNVK